MNPAPDPETTPPQPAMGDDRSHFLAHMGHDLRAPLTNILALAEAVRDGVYGPLNPQQSDTMGHIRDNGHRMLDMVTDLVDLARLETGQLSLERSSCSITEACSQGLELVRGLAKSKKVLLELRSTPDTITAEADARRMRQLTAALAGAAVASSPAEGHVRLRIEASPAGGKLWLQATSSKASVGSNPSDISKDAAAASPEMLHRLRKMTSVSTALAEKLVRLHEGSFGVSEMAGGGVAITVGLPMSFPPDTVADQTGAVDATGLEEEKGSTREPFILLADDEEIIRTITKDYLESVGYRVACATNGREALDLIHAEVPDLVIMDMQMPVLDGLEAMQQIRRSEDPRVARVPLISLSGLATPGHRERCLAAGANRCLAKPFGIKELELAITQTLEMAER